MKIGLGAAGIRLFDDDLKKLNKSDTLERPLHRIPAEFGGGYLGMIEVFHLLHCLNALRKGVYHDFYPEAVNSTIDGAAWKRVHTGK